MLAKAIIIFMFAGIVFSRYFIVGPAQIKVLSIDPCPNYTNLSLQLIIKPHMVNKTTQAFDGYAALPSDIDGNITVNLKASRVDKQKTQMNSFAINNAEVCPSLNKYVGELWSDIQSQIGMEPGVCPIKTGNYTFKNVILDLSKLKVTMLLEGRFQTIALVKNNTTPIYCKIFNILLFPKNQ